MKLAFSAIAATLIVATQASAMGLNTNVQERDAVLGAVYSQNMGVKSIVDADAVYTNDTLALNPVETVNQYDFSEGDTAALETGLKLGNTIR